MNDELDFDLETDQEHINNKVEQRIKSLAQKVEHTAKERDELMTAKTQIESEKESLAKERDFYKGFNVISSKHPEAANYQDQILERVNKGYDAEEATVAVLAKEGKLSVSAVTPQTQDTTAAGGSAATQVQGPKPLADLSQAEKLDALKTALGS